MTRSEALEYFKEELKDGKCSDTCPICNAMEWAIKALEQPERKKGEWTTHEVACLLAEVMGDECACNVNGNDEWLPLVCDFAETTCPNVFGVACWEQWLIHRKEKTDE